MAGRAKTFYLDNEAFEVISKEDNQSALVSKLIKGHFSIDLSKQELEKKKIELEEKQEKINKQLDHVIAELNEYKENPVKGLVVREV